MDYVVTLTRQQRGDGGRGGEVDILMCGYRVDNYLVIVITTATTNNLTITIDASTTTPTLKYYYSAPYTTAITSGRAITLVVMSSTSTS